MNWRTLRSLVRAEARTLARSISFWLYLGFCILLSIYTPTLSSPKANWLDVMIEVVRNLVFFQLPLLVWLASPMLVKTISTARDWLWVTSLGAPILVAAQAFTLYAGAVVSLVICTVVASLVFVWIQQLLAWSSIVYFWLYALAMLLPLTFFEVLLAFFLAIVFRRTLVTVSIVTVFSVALLMGLILPDGTLFSLLNYPLLFLQLDPVAGLGAEGPLLIGILAFYPCVGIGLIACAILVWPRFDARCGWKPRYHGWVILPLVLGLTGGGVAGLSHQWAAGQSTVPPPVTDQRDVWRVLTARSKARIVGGEIEVEHWLELQNSSSQPLNSTVFSLNTGLQIGQASINDQPIQVVREGEAIRLIHANDPIASQGVIQITLTYRGRPHLLREDYATAKNRRSDSRTILNFSRPVQTYLDENTIFLLRDGDWRAWPYTQGPHVTAHDYVEVSLPRQLTVVSSGEVIQQSDNQLHYRWHETLPKFLISAAGYQAIQMAEGTVYAPSSGIERDLERARLVLRTRRLLAEWLSVPPETAYAVVIPPYAQEIVVGADILTLPAFAGIPSPAQELSYRDPQWAARGLQRSIIQAVLEELVRWPSRSWELEGRSLSMSAECSYTNGQENCVIVNLGLPSPQAPYGRLTESSITPPLLYAWIIVLESRLPEAAHLSTEERPLWIEAQDGDIQAYSSLSERDLVPWGFTGTSYTQDVARYVNALYQVLDNGSDERLMKLLHYLRTNYPLKGTEALTEEAFSALLQRFSEQ